ncbi:unnamed protein product [Rotaria magnacalcarata]|uniref:Methyltransferase domain-containing protein n=3 Tax=Rotaria magnacalcarata TaxID=392030 RepID=A0A816P504_9BILA|nr:unnamed protein product [Rotaria magnacalcarata]CAF2139962.1 unnamed protein product [Rotaria magnacalcarata]CAF4117281.1 unnamed protein product [Rotaria magnacalcarata]CAF4248833.1 unnamed protein product [Rotaria magnacalcarata]
MTEQILLGIRDFLQPYLPLLNSHNVDYLTCNHWNTYVPEWIRQEDTVDLYDLFEKRYKQRSPARHLLEELIDQIVDWKRKIEQITYTREQFEEQILPEKCENELKSLKHTTRTFMSPKKEHEVEILAPIINRLANMVNIDSIIDYGSGRGYLGVKISYDYERNVLGIESSEEILHSGEKRIETLSKYQKELHDTIKYKTTSTIVNSETNFEKLFSETFDSYSSSFLLCSLHACGSLSCSLLNHFVENLSVRAVANVACCYHLLEEKFVANPFTNYYSENDPCSFPLSHRLIQEKAKLGRNARMLAVQSFERNKADQTLNAGLWYRALMQVLLVEIYGLATGLQDIKLGKLTKKSMTFEEYVWKAVDKLKLDKTKITSNVINNYWIRYESCRHQLHTFIQLKVLFSGLIEMMILLDRLVFLEESVPTASSYLVALFDPIKSPRRWCLVSLK